MAKAPTDIRSLARSYTDKAIKVLAGVMQQDEAPHSARVAAATALLDRGWGKPPQFVTDDVGKMRSALEMTDDELAAIAAGRSEGADTAPLDPSQLN